jgi:site-specific DNA-cytosine methylase
VQQFTHIEQTYKSFYLYCGLGGAALGAQQAEADFRGVKGRFEVLGGVDNDAAACRDFETLTGVPATCMDLFDREQYREWHGKEPPDTWREATPDDIRKAAKGEDPDMVVVTAPCLPSGSLVLTEHGPLPISLIQPGDRVLTHAGNYHRVDRVNNREYRGTMVSLRLNGNVDRQEFTDEHPIWVKRKSGHAFIPAKSVQVGDRIGFPIIRGQHGTAEKFVLGLLDCVAPKNHWQVKRLDDFAESPALWTLLGMYLGDGYRRHDEYQVAFCVGPVDGRKATIVRGALDSLGLSYRVDSYGGPGNVKIWVSNLHLWTLCGGMGDLADGKVVPEPLQALDDDLLDVFLDGYFAADGTSQPRRESVWGGRTITHNRLVRLSSISLPLLRSVQRLMLRKGQYWMVHPAGNGRPMVIEGRTVNAKPLFTLTYKETDGKRRPCSEFEGDTVWIRVRSTETRQESCPVWNLEVDTDDTYCVHLMATHNCKGFSGLLSEEKSKSTKYQALNKLTIRGIYLTLETWKHNPPSFILFENVPRIATRGKQKFIRLIKQILSDYGYVLDDRHHDCGVLGGLGQHRKRYLLIARLRDRVTSYCYNPPDQRVKSIGEIIDNLPMPDDQAAGPLHRLPRLQWKTWMRLALIPPGGDWRNLQNIEPGRYAIQRDGERYRVVDTFAESVPDYDGPDIFHNVNRMRDWDETAGAVTASPASAKDAPLVADPRGLMQPHMNEDTHPGKYKVTGVEEPGPTVTGSRLGSGAGIIADPRIGHTPMGGGKGAFWVQDSDQASGTVTADPNHRKSGGASVVADPRLPTEHGKNYAGSPGLMGVADSKKPSNAVTGSASVTGSNTPAAVADSRTPRFNNVQRVMAFEDAAGAVTAASGTSNAAPLIADPRGMAHASTYGNMLHVTDGAEPAQTVTGATGPNQGAGLIADPRFGCDARNGTMGVMDWEEPGTTVTANGDVHAGTSAVADPRIPEDSERGTWVIVSPHTDSKGRHCWHRPLTTLELLALQGFPTIMPDGSAMILDGSSDRAWRERVGNAVPPPTMKAITEQVLLSLIPSDEGIWRPDVFASGTWVIPQIEEVKGA